MPFEDNMREERVKKLQERAKRCLIMALIALLMAGAGELGKRFLGSDTVGLIWIIAFLVLAVVMFFAAYQANSEAVHLMDAIIDVRGMLGKYMKQESFRPKETLSREVFERFGLSYEGITGSNYYTGTLKDGRTLESACVRLTEGEIDPDRTSTVTLYTGQVAVLRKLRPYAGKLLLVRVKSASKSVRIWKYWNDKAPARVFRDSVGRTSKCPPYNLAMEDRVKLETSLPRDLSEQWAAFSDDRDKAQRHCANPAFYSRLAAAERLDFVLYDHENILLGGRYELDLSEGSPDEVREAVERTLDGLFNEAIPTVDAV